MTKVSIVLLALFLVRGSPLAHAALPSEGNCEDQKGQLIALLQEGARRLRVRLEEVNADPALSEESRGDFRQKTEWLIAWSKDHEERLKTLSDCTTSPAMIEDARAQFAPVALASEKLHATKLLWEVDRLAQDVRAFSGEASILSPLAESRTELLSVQEAKTLDEAGQHLRVGIFLVRRVLRMLRIAGIMG